MNTPDPKQPSESDELDAVISTLITDHSRGAICRDERMKALAIENAKQAIQALYAKQQSEAVDTPELRQLIAENSRLIEAGDALYERASYTGREFDGTHRLLSAAANWLDVRGKNSGEYQKQLTQDTTNTKRGEDE